MAKPRGKRPIPTRAQVLEFIRDSGENVTRREIARAFGVKGADRVALKEILRGLEDEGVLQKRRGRRYADPNALPPVTVLEITGLDPDGDVLARPVNWPDDVPPPTIYVGAEKHRGEAPGVADRVLARLRRLADETYEADIIKRLGRERHAILGVYTAERNGGYIESTDRRSRADYFVPPGDHAKAVTGDFVRAEITAGRRHGVPQAKVVEILGNMEDPGSASLIAIQGHGIPTEFPPAALQEAAEAKPFTAKRRADLRHVPLVTIDDADARDFDDAVWAERDGDGWHLVVAIADVAWYVRPARALDATAHERGNSVYFPDRVVPMLPEELSNGLCSLKPDEDRPCMAVHLWIDASGKKRRHKFERGVMKSAARLTYKAVQAAIDGKPDKNIRPLMGTVIEPLYGAYAALRDARDARGVLDLDLPELRAVLDESGNITKIEPRERFDSHRLIEEFMILANVAAAETLERRRQPCMYRVHDQPPREKLESLAEYLDSLGLRFAKGQVVTAGHFNRLLKRAAGTPHAEAVSEAVLRSQSQAVYDPENIGHFGLALRRYAHFTSPIRRYADLLVHRALIAALDAGEGGLEKDGDLDFEETAEHISNTERRAAAAEREAMDRLTTAFLAERVGAEFDARISGVTRAGLFVRLDGLGADGLVPMSSLGAERFLLDEGIGVTGQRSGLRYRLGEKLRVRLMDADTVAGRLAFTVVGEPARPRKAGRTARKKAAKRKSARRARRR